MTISSIDIVVTTINSNITIRVTTYSNMTTKRNIIRKLNRVN